MGGLVTSYQNPLRFLAGWGSPRACYSSCQLKEAVFNPILEQDGPFYINYYAQP